MCDEKIRRCICRHDKKSYICNVKVSNHQTKNRDYGWGRNYIANHITWKVRNQVIYIHFVEENSNIEIGNYRLDDDYFTGIIYLDGRSARFSLRHTSSPNWNNYVFGYDGFYDYGWAKSDGPSNPVSAPRRHLGNPDEIAK